MFERFRSHRRSGTAADAAPTAIRDPSMAEGEAGAGRPVVADRAGTAEQPLANDRPVADRDRAVTADRPLARERPVPTAERGEAYAPRRRQYAEYGGVNSGSAFFGWLVAVGIATLLIALLSAAGTAIGLTSVTASDANNNAGTIGIVGGALLLVVLLIAYYAGGYVAGRMSRFDGGRQGAAVWLWGLVITLILAGAGAAFGSKYNVLAKLNLPRIPIDEGSLATGGVITLGAILLGTLLASLAGGKVGQRYHRRVDLAADRPVGERYRDEPA